MPQKQKRGENDLAAALLSRTAPSRVPVTGMAGRFMVPKDIADRWAQAATMEDMMQILEDQQTFQSQREKNPLAYPDHDLVDGSMLPLIRPDVSNLTTANLKLLDETALDVFESTLRADEAESIARNKRVGQVFSLNV